jgi:putative addiction module CopG family antidote
LSVHISADLEKRIQEKLAAGSYRSADEVISEALLALEQRDQQLAARATAFKQEIERRLASGPAVLMDFAAVKRAIREKIAAHKGERH